MDIRQNILVLVKIRIDFTINVLLVMVVSSLFVGCEKKIKKKEGSITENESVSIPSKGVDSSVPHELAFYTEEISPNHNVRVNSSHSMIRIEQGSITLRNTQYGANSIFYAKEGDILIIPKSGVYLWRWDFSPRSKPIKGLTTDYQNTSSRKGSQMLSSTQIEAVNFDQMDSLHVQNGFVLRVEKMSIQKGKILNNIKVNGVGLGVLNNGEIKVSNSKKSYSNNEREETWPLEYGVESSISSRTSTDFFMAYVLPSELYEQPVNFPSLISKSDGKPKGTQKVVLNVKVY